MATRDRYYLNAAGTLWTRYGRGSTTVGSGSGGGGTDPRAALVYGSYIPGPTTTGVRTVDWATGAPITFTDQYGTSGVFTAASGATYTNVNFWCKVATPTGAADIHFNNCRFYNQKPEDMYAASASGNGGCIQNFGSNPPHLFLKDCTFNPKGWFDAGLSSYWGHPVQVGIHGGNYTAERCEFVNCQDAINGIGPNTSAPAIAAYQQLWACWVHKNFYLKPWTGPGSPASQDTHSDAFQTNTGANHEVRWNMLGGQHDEVGYTAATAYNSGDDCHNSCLMMQQEQDTTAIANVGNVNFSDNWCAGGAATLNINLKNSNAGTDWTVARNKIARRGATEWAGNGYYIYLGNGVTPALSDNVIWDPAGSIAGTGVAAPINCY